MGKTQKERLSIASVVANDIKSKVNLGAPNLSELANRDPKVQIEMIAAIKSLRRDAALARYLASSKTGGMTPKKRLEYFKTVMELSDKYEVAMCGEFVRAVFWTLYQKSVFPIAYVTADNVDDFGNHSFCVIGIKGKEGDIQYMKKWDSDVVICDPWLMLLRKHIKTSKSEYTGAYTVDDFIKTTKKYFRDGDKVRIRFCMEKAL